MKTFFTVLSWIFAFLFFLLLLLSLCSRQFIPSIFVLLIMVLLIPPVRQYIGDSIGYPLPLWMRSIATFVFIILYIFLIFKGMGNKHSIYKNSRIEQELMAIYDERMTEWPVPFEDRFLDTEYGRVYVVMSGPEHAPPVLLLHASAMSSWSWQYNVEGLSRYYRTYAIDTIGDAGRSVLDDVEKYPADGESISRFYTRLMDSLEVQKACFIGASQGGFITTNLALYAPERVEKIVLCGPMGYTGTTSSVLRIMFTTMFPVKPVRISVTRWAFGNDPRINDIVAEWFGFILEGVISRQARPFPFTKEQLRSLSVPVLLILGERDGLVGDPEKGRELAKNIPDVQVEILDTGHLISAEKPDQFNKIVLDFLGQK
jgi:pimeloyl-ACP methyl ester carboxylesterase